MSEGMSSFYFKTTHPVRRLTVASFKVKEIEKSLILVKKRALINNDALKQTIHYM